MIILRENENAIKRCLVEIGYSSLFVSFHEL